MVDISNAKPFPPAHVEVQVEGNTLRLYLGGTLNAAELSAIWNKSLPPIRTGNYTNITVDCGGIDSMDGAGLALLLKLQEEASRAKGTFSLLNLRDEYQQLVDMTGNCENTEWTPLSPERRGFAIRIGEVANEQLSNIKDMVSFVGEATVTLIWAISHPHQVRWKDVVLSCINVGVDSLFIITLIGFLMGLIMSFQSAISLQRFGGEIFVPNMLGLVMFREMGPLVTSILLAARSGSAFAAEIGTMKINEELDALTTMGLSPMKFLVLPKLLAALTMVPIMTLIFNLASLIGGAIVMLSLGFPLVTFTSRVFAYLNFLDFWGGLAKALVFASLVAGIGCLRGMQTRSSASGVGLSTTSAVVSGIILIAFADGIFAMAFYYLGW